MVLFYLPEGSPVINRYTSLVATLKLARFFDPLRSLRIYRPDGYLLMTKSSTEAKDLPLLVRELPYAITPEPREVIFLGFKPVPEEVSDIDIAVEGRAIEVHYHDNNGTYHELALSEALLKDVIYGYDVRYEDRPDPAYDEGTIEVPTEVTVILAGFKGDAEKDAVIAEVIARLVELYGIRGFSIEENFTGLKMKLEGDRQ